MFTKEIEEALADGRVDLAVHSLKDLPTELPPGFELVAVTQRVNPRDVFLSIKYESVNTLPQGARVGTSSLRRQAQLKVARPDLDVNPLRGNVDTRVRKLEQGEYDAIILAAAGLTRLGKTQHIKEYLSEEFMCPAAGQGALGIEIREGDLAMRCHLEFLNDAAALAATVCERALLNKLGGGCQVPIGAFAEMRDGVLHLTGVVARPDGSEILREQQTGSDPVALGELVGDTLLGEARPRSWKMSIARRKFLCQRSRDLAALISVLRESLSSERAKPVEGLQSLSERVRKSPKQSVSLAGCRVLVSRAKKQAGALSLALRALGCDVVEIPFIEIRKPRSFQPLDTALRASRITTGLF